MQREHARIMACVEKVVENVPSWVETLLIPPLETRVRAVVKEEVGHLEKTMNAKSETVDSKFEARLDALGSKFGAKLDGISTRIDSLEKLTSG